MADTLLNPPLSRRQDISLDSIIAFGSLTNPNVAKGHHANMEAAKSAGLKAPVAYSLHYAGLVSDLMFQRFGASWAAQGEMSLAFLKPVYAGDVVDIRIGERPLLRPEEASTEGAIQVDIFNQEMVLVASGYVVPPLNGAAS